MRLQHIQPQIIEIGIVISLDIRVRAQLNKGVTTFV